LTTSRAIPCLRAAGGDWKRKIKYFDDDYMDDCLPRDTKDFEKDYRPSARYPD
jgi:hypothetical protein